MRRSAIVALVVAALAGGCGGGGSSSTGPPKEATAPNAPAGSAVVACKEGRMEIEELHATAVACAAARDTMRAWERSHACTLGNGSRSSCALGDFRCQAVRSGPGASVACARPGGDVSFIAKAWLLRKSNSR